VVLELSYAARSQIDEAHILGNFSRTSSVRPTRLLTSPFVLQRAESSKGNLSDALKRVLASTYSIYAILIACRTPLPQERIYRQTIWDHGVCVSRKSLYTNLLQMSPTHGRGIMQTHLILLFLLKLVHHVSATPSPRVELARSLVLSNWMPPIMATQASQSRTYTKFSSEPFALPNLH